MKITIIEHDGLSMTYSLWFNPPLDNIVHWLDMYNRYIGDVVRAVQIKR